MIPVNVINSWNQKDQILGLKLESKGQSKLIPIPRSEVTLWQKFLHLFNLGKFANIELSVNKVATHLAQFDWKSISDLIAYLKVCNIANKAFVMELDERVCRSVVDVPITEKGSAREGGYRIKKTRIYWNPRLTAGDIRNRLGAQGVYVMPKAFLTASDHYYDAYLDDNTQITRQHLKNLVVHMSNPRWVFG